MASHSTDVCEEAPSELSLEIITEAIENIREARRRPDEESISLYLVKTGLLSKNVDSDKIVSAAIRQFENSGLIMNRPTKDGDSYFVCKLATKTSENRIPATIIKEDKSTKSSTRNQEKPELSLDFGMQFNTGNINFTPYSEFITLRNQVKELMESAKNEDLKTMKERVSILEREKKKLSDENISLKRELIKLQDLLANHRSIPREEPPIANKSWSKNRTEPIEQNSIEFETTAHRNRNWSYPRVSSSTRTFITEKPNFESRNRFQQLSNLSESREDTYPGVARRNPYFGAEMTASYAEAAMENTRNGSRAIDLRREERNQQPENNFSQKKKVIIIGDSMLKQIKRKDINYHLQDTVTHVKTFPGATSEDMSSYLKPTLKSSPDEIILHCGTNDLRYEEPKEIAERIIGIAKEIESHGQKATVSGLIRRTDSPEMETKRRAVNVLLGEMLRESRTRFITHENVNPVHLNRWGLHLNQYGSKVITENFTRYLTQS
eukprot:gene6564-7305_t